MGIEATVTKVIPLGKPKSGRDWKVRQTSRFSSQNRQGILKHLSTTYEDKRRQREELSTIKALEKEMKEDTKNKKLEEKQRREEKQKIRMANEYKSTSYQEINPELIKKMNKKQLRMVKKTTMNKNGQVQLVNPWTNAP